MDTEDEPATGQERAAGTPGGLLGDPKDLYRSLDRIVLPLPKERGVDSWLEEIVRRCREGPGNALDWRAVEYEAPRREYSARDSRASISFEPESSCRVAVLEVFNESEIHRVRISLGEEADATANELLLHTLGSILTLRLQEERIGRVLGEAAEIQRSLLPVRPPVFKGFEIAFRSLAAEEVGGDLLDFQRLDDDSLIAVVGDASGHGLPAALLARDVVIALRMGIERDLRMGIVLSRLNRVVHGTALSSAFVSLVCAELESNGSLFYFLAGHEPPLLIDGQGIRKLRGGGTVVGPLAEVRYARRFAHVDRGATLALYTDGLLERRSPEGELFGIERLGSSLAAGLEGGTQAALDRVFDDVREFGSDIPWEDDATLLLIHRTSD